MAIYYGQIVKKKKIQFSTYKVIKNIFKKYLKVTTKEHVMQGSSNLFLEGRCPAEFSSNPNQTHLKQLIKVLLGILQTSRQVCWG